mgnify:CR=1 FL=1
MPFYYPESHLSLVSTIPTSLTEPQIRFSVDKLILKAPRLLSTEHLLSFWRNNSLQYEDYFEKRRPIGYKVNGVSIKCSNLYRNSFNLIVVNPTDFSSLEESLSMIRYVLPPEIVDELKLYQTDLAADLFNIEFEKNMVGLTISQKFCFIQPHHRSGKKESHVVGKYPEVIKAYNKRLQIQRMKGPGAKKYREILNEHWTRFEISLRLSKLPTRIPSELIDHLLNPNFNPFNSIVLRDIDFTPPCIERANPTTLIRFGRFQGICEANGFYFAKSFFSRSNFPRDYKDFFHINHSFRLGDYFHDGMKIFISGKAALCP